MRRPLLALVPETDGLLPLVIVVGGIVILVVMWWFRSGPSVTSGRERYDSGGVRDSIRSGLANGDIEVDRVDKRDRDGSQLPEFTSGVSCMVLGQTGTGKSTFVKHYVDTINLDTDGATIAHALSEPGQTNEFVEFFGARGKEVIQISSRDSTHRWDPLMEYGSTLRDLETLATGMFETRDVKETGWTEPAKSLLTCALAVTAAKERDFAALPEVLDRGPAQIVRECKALSSVQTATVTASIEGLEKKNQFAAYTTLLNQIRPLLLSDLVAEEKPRLSLQTYLSDPENRVLVLDNVSKDRYARGFWRFFLQSAIDVAFSTQGRQQFLLDEFDKLPCIDNLPRLVSAGRSAEVVGVLVAQDVNQIERRYEEMTRSLWTNAPNRVAFRSGDTDTSELILSGIGEVELPARSIAHDGEEINTLSTQMTDRQPLLTGDLMGLDVGEALVQSRSGWWVTKLSEPDISPPEQLAAQQSTDQQSTDQQSKAAAGQETGATKQKTGATKQKTGATKKEKSNDFSALNGTTSIQRLKDWMKS